jgi:hypothetical protein
MVQIPCTYLNCEADAVTTASQPSYERVIGIGIGYISGAVCFTGKMEARCGP